MTSGDRFDEATRARPSWPVPPETPPPRRGPPLLLLGAAAAVAAGVGAALFALPRLEADPPPPDDKQVSIVVDPVKPPPIPKSNGPMEVLAPGMAEAAAPPPVVADQALPDGAASPQSALSAAGPSFDCAGRLSRGQAVVCSDPELSALDRRMARAYAEAAAAGAPPSDLRAEQADWRGIREDAAGHSPEAVAQIYEQRIRELEDLADFMARR